MFRDRFYSTRPPRSYRRYGSRGNSGLILFMAIVILILILLLGMMLWLNITGHKNDYALQHEAVTVEAPLEQDQTALEQQRDAFNQKIVNAAERASQAVVSVIRYRNDENGKRRQAGIGSGVIVENERGKVRVATNYHVIDGGDSFEVVLYDETVKQAKVIGKDLLSDLAVLEMDEEGVHHYAVFGDSDKLKVGDAVLAIGNPLGLGFSHTTTFGVISSINRSIPISLGNNGFYDWEMRVIQTDAAINRGNSGGALVNLEGEVIGINNMKVANFGVEGLGFAIPSNTAVPVIRSLIEHGKVKRPFMGVATLDYDYITDDMEVDLPRGIEQGLLIMSVSGPAAEAGLQKDDFIVALDDQKIATTIELRKYLYEQKEIGEQLKVTYYRDRKKQTIVLTLGESE